MATYDQLTEWAGLGHVTRARRDVVADWRIPDFMKVQLVEVGIPVAPRLIERVAIQRLIRFCSRSAVRSTVSTSRRISMSRPTHRD
ncbi:SUKH-4 family immunity protein [Streptomyces sp. NPDC088358]|uniref:SUKH-4 family immunity protein n=1 Tax=Streptomyces sp. NPDC088358 TaxID=3365857 RepID=UPI0038109FEF